MSQRTERFAVLIQRELGELLREVRHPALQEATLVTVTHVRVAADLGVAWIAISVIAEDPVAVIRAVGRARPFLQGRLGRRLRAKKIPQLRFHLDDTEERVEMMDGLLSTIADEPPVGESSDPAAPERVATAENEEHE